MSRHLPRIATLFAVLAWSLALSDIGLRLTRPQTVAALPLVDPDPAAAARQIAMAAPFGASGADAAAPALSYTLSAVATGFGTAPGFAVLESSDGRRLPVLVGDVLDDGSRLVNIGADQVVLERNGQRSAVLLRASNGGETVAVPSTVAVNSDSSTHLLPMPSENR